jgi:hypothetical protein
MKPSRIPVPAFVAALLLASAAGSVAAPTPVPGGANQVAGMSGAVGQTLFNGVVRLTIQSAGPATDASDLSLILPSASQKALLITALIKNGTHAPFAEVLTYTLADTDGVTFDVPSYMVKPNPVSLAQGAAVRQRLAFPVDKAYAPVKLLVQCSTCKKNTFKAFRVTLPAIAAPPASPPSPGP